MDTRLNLYPDKMIAQCINAISLLSDANEALSSLKFEINEFVNDSYIHSVSFDELKKQCQNYTTVIDAMINCNEADIADFTQLQVDVGSEELIGAIIDKWERYYKQKIEETRQNYENTKGMVSGYARVQMESYYANMIQMYETLYQQWYQKELLYYEIDGKTSSLFAKSYGRQTISNMLEGLKASFTLNGGYNANVVAAQNAEMEKAITESVPINPAEKAVWDAMIKSGKMPKEASKILSSLKAYCPEQIDRISAIISHAGYSEGVKASGILEQVVQTKITEHWNGTVADVGDWYRQNIHTYCCLNHKEYRDVVAERERQKADGVPKNEWVSTTDKGRRAYICDIDGELNGKKVYDDCSSFVYANLCEAGYFDYSEFTSPPTAKLYLPGVENSIASEMEKAGFTWYSQDELDASEVRKGDILVRESHVEIFDRFDSKSKKEYAYTWGKIYDEIGEPASKENDINTLWKKDNSDSGYEGVWRYEGDI